MLIMIEQQIYFLESGIIVKALFALASLSSVLFNQYALYLWEYYVENASKEPPKPKAPPKVPVAKKLKVEKAEPEPPQVTTEGEFEGYGDDDDMITVEGAVERAVKRD